MSLDEYDNFVNVQKCIEYVYVKDYLEELSDPVNLKRYCSELSCLSYYDLAVSVCYPEAKIAVVAERYGCSVIVNALINVEELVVLEYDAELVEVLYHELLIRENRDALLQNFHAVPIVILHNADNQLIVLQGGNRIQALKRYSRHHEDLKLFSIDIIVKEDIVLSDSVKLLLSCLCYGPNEKQFTRKFSLTETVKILKKLSLIKDFYPSLNFKRSLDETIRYMMFCLIGHKPQISMIRRFLLLTDLQYSIVVPAITDMYKTDSFFNVFFPTFEMAPRKLFNVLCYCLKNNFRIEEKLISRDKYIHDWDIILWKIFKFDECIKWLDMDIFIHDVFPKYCNYNDTTKEMYLDLFFSKIRIWRSIIRTRNPEKRCKKLIRDFEKFLCDKKNLISKKKLVKEAYISIAKNSSHTPYYCNRVTLIKEEIKQDYYSNSIVTVDEQFNNETHASETLIDDIDFKNSVCVSSFIQDVQDDLLNDNVFGQKNEVYQVNYVNDDNPVSYCPYDSYENFGFNNADFEVYQVCENDCSSNGNYSFEDKVDLFNGSCDQNLLTDGEFYDKESASSAFSEQNCCGDENEIEEKNDFFDIHGCKICPSYFCDCSEEEIRNGNNLNVLNNSDICLDLDDNSDLPDYYGQFGDPNDVDSLQNIYLKASFDKYMKMSDENLTDVIFKENENIRKRRNTFNDDQEVKRIRIMQ